MFVIVLNLGHFIGATQILNQKWDIYQARQNMRVPRLPHFSSSFLFGAPITNQGPRNVAYLNELLLLDDL